MATFTDNSSAFLSATNPYISQVPVQAYANTEAILQQRHDLGVQKVQEEVNSINSLPLLKDTDRQYAQESLNNIRTSLINGMPGDFKDPRFTSQVGGLIKRISSDPILQNSINSTMSIQSSNKRMQEDIDKGIVNPANQVVYQKQVAAYLNDGQTGSRFTGGYVPPVDYKKIWLDQFKQLHPQSSLSEGDLIINNNGQLQVSQLGLLKTKNEGINQATLQNLTRTVFSDPAVNRQLHIEAEFNYGDYTPEQMQEILQNRYNQDAQSTNARIASLQLDATINNKIPKTQAAQEAQQSKDQLKERLENYQKMVSNLGVNPAAVKADLYKSDQAAQLVNTFAWQNTEQEIVANPVDQAQLAHISSQLALQKATLAQQNADRSFALDQQKFSYQQSRDLVTDQLAADKLTGGVGSTTDAINPVDQAQGEKNATTFQSEIDKANIDSNMANGKNINLIAAQSGIPLPYRFDEQSGKYLLNVGAGGYDTPQKAIVAGQDITRKLYHGNYAASLTPIAKQAIIEMDGASRNLKNLRLVDKRIQEQVDQATEGLSLTPDAKKLIKEPANITITSGGFAGLKIDNAAMINALVSLDATDPQVKKSALRALNQQVTGKGDESEGLLQNIDRYTSSADKAKIRNLLAKNPALKQLATYKQQLYSDAQQGQQTYNHTFNISKDSDLRGVLSEIKGLVSNQAEINGGADNIGKILNLDPTNKNLIPSWKSNVDGGLTISVRNGNEDPIEVSLTPQAAQRASFFKAPSEFKERYGKDLALTNYTTTDVDTYYSKAGERGSNAGLASAHIVPGNSKYTVKYQVLGTGTAGQYTVQGWVYDKNGNLLLNNVPLVPPGSPQLLNEAGVLSVVDKVLPNDATIKAMVQYHQNVR